MLLVAEVRAQNGLACPFSFEVLDLHDQALALVLVLHLQCAKLAVAGAGAAPGDNINGCSTDGRSKHSRRAHMPAPLLLHRLRLLALLLRLVLEQPDLRLRLLLRPLGVPTYTAVDVRTLPAAVAMLPPNLYSSNVDS